MALLVRLGKEGVEETHMLSSFPLTIGRQNDNEIVVSDTRISRRHAKIEERGGRVVLTDLESTHRTYINSQPIENQVLQHGDHINLGKKIDFLYLDHEDPNTIERYMEDYRQKEGPAEESSFALHVSRQMDSLLDSLKSRNMDTLVLKKINDEVSRSVAELKCLYEVGNAINSELELDRVLDVILNHVIRACQGERGFIMLTDEQTGNLNPVAARNMEESLSETERSKFSRSIAQRSVDSRSTIVTKDTATDPAITTKSVVDYNIRSAICAPLVSKGQVIGVLYVDAKESLKEFSAKDVEFFTALANQSAIAIENAQLYANLKVTIQQLDRKIKELTALYSISNSLMNVNDLDSVLSTILDKSIETIGSDRGSIMMYADNEDFLVVKVIRGQSKPEIIDRIKLRKGEGIAGRVVATGQGIICNEGYSSPMFKRITAREEDIKQILCVPLQGNKEVIGVINLINKKGNREFTNDDLQLLTSIASQAAVTIENTRLYDLAVYDGLTRVFVRRYFDAWLIKEFERAKRYGSDLSIILVDIDHFKHVNDTYGHQVGDAVLIELAKVFKETIRSVDIVSRYGGEEFVIGLPQTHLDGAELFANRLRQKVEEKTLNLLGNILNITISLGVSDFKLGNPGTVKDMIKLADKVLYQAKAAGRNQVCTHRPVEE